MRELTVSSTSSVPMARPTTATKAASSSRPLCFNRLMITDTSSYMRENYTVGEEYIEISLKKIDAIPSIINDVLCDQDRCGEIAHAAYDKAVERETWDERASRMKWILCERL